MSTAPGRSPPPRAQLAVVGAGQATPAQCEVARAVGSAVARRGALLVCGGLGGVMEAACQRAREAGGQTLGLLPGTDRRAANPYVQVAVPTGMGELRNGLIVRVADALIAVGGEWGTLSEIALALKVGKPVVGLDTWQLDRPDGVQAASDPVDAVERALALAGSSSASA